MASHILTIPYVCSYYLNCSNEIWHDSTVRGRKSSVGVSAPSHPVGRARGAKTVMQNYELCRVTCLGKGTFVVLTASELPRNNLSVLSSNEVDLLRYSI